MTVVAGVSVGGMPAFIGDLLISWRVLTAVDLLTRADPGITAGLNDHFVSSLEPKLVLIELVVRGGWRLNERPLSETWREDICSLVGLRDSYA